MTNLILASLAAGVIATVPMLAVAYQIGRAHV
jgi:hypothetical protein